MNLREIPVRLGDRSYVILIGRDARRELPDRLQFLREGNQIAVVTSSELRALYGDALVESLHAAGFQAWIAEMPDGERYKTLATAGLLYDQFVERRMERGSLVIALGGGVVGDIAGFVAATYMRGVPFVQMPTTLIAQVDSSVGGKVAVDHPKGKNLIGAFYQPRLVIADIATLDTLPDRQFRAGLAEALRYGVIASPSLFETMERRMERIMRREADILTDIIAESCAIKARIVEQDETESGLRATMNYGHTFAHAIETATRYERFLHGEAVALGMVCVAEMAFAHEFVSREFCDRQKTILDAANLPTVCPDGVDVGEVVRAMSLDKKVVGGRIRFIVPRDVGEVEIRDDFSPEDVQRAIERTR